MTRHFDTAIRSQALAALPDDIRLVANLSNRAQLAMHLATGCIEDLDHALRDHDCERGRREGERHPRCRLCELLRDASGIAYALDQLTQCLECGMDCYFLASAQFGYDEVRTRTAILDARLNDVMDCELPNDVEEDEEDEEDEEEAEAVSPDTVIA